MFVSTQVPRLFDHLVDDAAVFPPGSAPLPEALAAHRGHRSAWYADLMGPLLVPASALTELAALLDAGERGDGERAPGGTGEAIDIGVVGDVAIPRLYALRDAVDPRLRIRQVEVAVAKRGEDPQLGLAELAGLPTHLEDADVYAEIPLTWGLLRALDRLAEWRAGGTRIAAKFRTGGLAAELFPTPVELAAVICACRDRGLPFKLTAGLHHALRHTDSETGFVHHGFVNVLVATGAAADGAEVAQVAELLATTDPLRLVEPARTRRQQERPLWIGFGSCSMLEPLTDLIRLGLVNGGFET